MSRRAELISLLIADAISLGFGFYLFYAARFEWGWLDDPVTHPPFLLLPLVFICSFWLLLFVFAGMYRERYAASRFDEIVSLVKVVTVGMLVLFFLIFIDDLNPGRARSNLLSYWFLVFGLVTLGRIGVRSVQKALILRGYGTHNALIVGWSVRVEELYAEVKRYPAAGLNVVGVIRMEKEVAVPAYSDGNGESLATDGARDRPLNGNGITTGYTIQSLPRLIDELAVQDVLIALGPDDRQSLTEVLKHCDGKQVSLKLVPDFYSVVGGMARTEHMYGLPLIEVLPEPMPPWEKSTKRLLDIMVSAIVLIAGLPIWLLVALAVKFTSTGDVIYRQVRVGRHGHEFVMYKFRTMHVDAELRTGPVWATEDDHRFTPVGRWLRKWRIDEIPQFINVLKGNMSLVGPRPERPYFVEKLAEEIPLYHRRQRVKPGITGLAQVKWKYDSSLDDVRQKVKYDLFYIENMSLRMDFKILFQTLRTAFLGQGQ